VRPDLCFWEEGLSKILILVAALAALTGPARAATGPEVTDFKLSNGLEVVVVPDHRAPVVTHIILYLLGSCLDRVL
jgi:zinc protease